MQHPLNGSQSHLLSSLDHPASSHEVQAMFDAIAPRYDLLNWVLSGGMHKLWERRLLGSLPRNSAGCCLDLCTGTGALVPALSKRFKRVVGVDISREMLFRARTRYAQIENAEWQEGDAQSLTFEDNSFDIVTVAYGVRNWPERERGLQEIVRVLKVGGSVGILEFGQPINSVWRRVFQAYSKYIIPIIGGVISGSSTAYEYLPKTSAAFPCGTQFLEMLSRCGFSQQRCIPLMGGVAYIYIAQKPSVERL
jgi:demethylmenaquinone methyltransferase/2-methoxy-6-polyprenyl-1,4-benzoquinol methylase